MWNKLRRAECLRCGDTFEYRAFHRIEGLCDWCSEQVKYAHYDRKIEQALDDAWERNR